MSVRVVSASQAAELDAGAMANGVPSRALMQAAGRSAAALLLERFPLESARGVAIYAGPGNNGGDAWVVAGELARRGVRVRVAEIAEPRTPDAIAARETARVHLDRTSPIHTEGVIVDGLLGTGATGAPRGAIAEAIERIAIQRAPDASGARGVPPDGSLVRVVALDVPSGVDATTGATPGAFVRADLTVTFGSLKRGLLVNREATGTLVVTDIGLGAASARFAQAPLLVDAAMVRSHVPRIGASAHKGIRKRLAIVGGALGMAGAPVLAARAAMRSGIGMVKLCVARESMGAVQSAEPGAMAVTWPESEDERAELLGWAHALLIGPGIGATPRARVLVGELLSAWSGPVVLDADALTMFAGEPAALGALFAASRRTRASPAVITPHVVEFARLAGLSAEEVEARRFDLAGELARTINATVLLKGVPTVISDGATTLVSATGTPVLATAGSGDVLGGIVATLVAQTGDALESAATGAWVHGRAAEIAAGAQVRGITLADVLDSLRTTWRIDDVAPGPPTLAELPMAGDRPA
jgi:ADP-dependent NAD(P)H-hydrate dehydratase / NAD(P)H-hydrate epimerase